jgi:hypothetical protein
MTAFYIALALGVVVVLALVGTCVVMLVRSPVVQPRRRENLRQR